MFLELLNGGEIGGGVMAGHGNFTSALGSGDEQHPLNAVCGNFPWSRHKVIP